MRAKSLKQRCPALCIAMSFLPSVECGEFKLKKAFQSGKILACTKKSEICAASTLKLIKMILKC